MLTLSKSTYFGGATHTLPGDFVLAIYGEQIRACVFGPHRVICTCFWPTSVFDKKFLRLTHIHAREVREGFFFVFNFIPGVQAWFTRASHWENTLHYG